MRKLRPQAVPGGLSDAAPASSLEEFGSEDQSAPAANSPAKETTSHTPGRPVQIFLLVLAVLLAAAGGAAYWKLKMVPARAAAALGSLTIESDPAGLSVVSGGATKGKTPLTLSLPAGTHQFELIRDGGGRQPLTVAIQRGATVVHHVRFEPAAPLAATGTLSVATDPAKLKVSVDGVLRGVSPVTVEALPAGSHKVEVHSASGILTRSVEIAAGQAASVIVTAAAAAPAQGAGWLALSSPVPVQIFEGSDLIGTSESARLMLPSGRHSLTVVNKSLGYSETKAVQVPANGSAGLKIDLPKAPVNLNALPWATAWIDGVAVGETPIGKHLVTIGSHEVIFRNPDLGERRQTVLVTLLSPARVSVDLRKP